MGRNESGAKPSLKEYWMTVLTLAKDCPTMNTKSVCI